MIGIPSDSALADPLIRVTQGEAVNGHALTVKRVNSPMECPECQMVVMTGVDATRAGRWLSELKDTPVLTIGDGEEFLATGGILRFVTEANRVGFDVNLEAARRAGLQVNGRLLKVARRVYGGGSGVGGGD